MKHANKDVAFYGVAPFPEQQTVLLISGLSC
jgi:hypothetical protein